VDDVTREERQAARLAQGADAVFSEGVAAELLPFRDDDALAWLRSSGLVRERPELGKYVIWGEVLAALAGEARKPKPTPKAEGGTLPRAGVYRPKGR
jgi:hypothetical protein